jgi:5'-AMP-activated protein kinase catalytic alpha subunit
LLHTTCGSPNYVAPEVLANEGYDGAASDIWSCGVILYVILTGCLPFDDANLAVICRKIFKGDPPIPRWISLGAKTMIKRMLDPNPVTRVTIAGIKAHDWFKHDYTPSNYDDDDDVYLIQEDVFMMKEYEEEKSPDSPTIINAFQLIGMSSFLDLSGFFETEKLSERQIRFTSNSLAKDLLENIETIFTEMGFCLQKKHAKVRSFESFALFFLLYAT